ncbi:MAG TPA: radical SAM protein [Kiritimatiellia bacterium]|nr:radical SAM protein [Kiritimatiellia bacterium]
MRFDVDFERAPLLVIWEVTRSCALACRHCRASAEDRRDPRELSLEEGKDLLNQVKAMGTPLMIFTGGDPLQRDDLEDLIRHAKQIGLRPAAIPAATPRLSRERMFSLKAAGLEQVAISIDASTAEKHDDFRKVEGTFAKAMEGAAWAHEAGIPLQVNTVLGSWNVENFDAIATLVQQLDIVFWEVFFLVPTGRGAELQGCTPAQMAMLFEKLYDLSLIAPFVVKITEAQHFRCYAAKRTRAMPPGTKPRLMMSGQPVNAGCGICFVDHIGNVCPSGFLPLERGNVRTAPLATIYRDDPVFRELRDFEKLSGRCALCADRAQCSGGSRARAYALTGNYLAPDPLCAL